jgi:hypothetical protein
MKPFLLALLFPLSAIASEAPSFRRDVLPILFRSGCNQVLQ